MSQSGTDAGMDADSGAGGNADGADARTSGQPDQPPMPTRWLRGPVVLVVSPHAGRAANGDAAAEALSAAGVELGEVLPVSALDRTQPLGGEWQRSGYRAAIAAGGDGTIGAVASHVSSSTLPLGILPLGTSNDTARSLGIPIELGAAAQVIAEGYAGQIDAGQAFPAQTAPLATTGDEVDPAGETGMIGAYFLHALTLGFNVQFARLATGVARRERLGGLNYAVSLVQALATYRPVSITLRFKGLVEPAELRGAEGQPGQRDERDQTGASGATSEIVVAHDALELAAVNAPVFGGAFNFRVPQIDMHDRLLDFVLFEALDPQRLRATIEGMLAALARLPNHGAQPHPGAAVAGRSDAELGLALPGVHRYRARAAVIESERPLDITLDGEVRAQTPTLVRVAPQLVSVLLPASPR
jgi:diacylglycerol kinase family enzyme